MADPKWWAYEKEEVENKEARPRTLTMKGTSTDFGFNSTSFSIKTFKSLPNFCNISRRNAIRFTASPKTFEEYDWKGEYIGNNRDATNKNNNEIIF